MATNKKHILIADDEVQICMSLSILLRDAGYRVTAVHDGRTALAKLSDLMKSDGTDLLLTDIRMPDMDGLELIREVKKINPSLPIFVLTAYGHKNIVAEISRLGCSYADKPYKPEELLSDIALLMEKRNF